jgi:hypothetical protein
VLTFFAQTSRQSRSAPWTWFRNQPAVRIDNAASLQATETGGQRTASAIAYLESDQDDDGSWHSRWYWGRHYGTYRAVLALTSVASDSRAAGPCPRLPGVRAERRRRIGRRRPQRPTVDGARGTRSGRPRPTRHRSLPPARLWDTYWPPSSPTAACPAALPLHRLPSRGRTRNPHLPQQHHNDKLLPQGHPGTPGSPCHRAPDQAARHTRRHSLPAPA